MGELLELVYAVLFRPREALPALAERPPVGLAAGVVAGVAFLQALAGGGLPLWAAALAVPVALGAWFGTAAAWHLAAELLGGRGSGRATLALAGLAGLPGLLLPPLMLLARAAGMRGGLWLPAALGLWMLWLCFQGLRAAHGLSPARALAALLAPALAAAALAAPLLAGLASLLAG